eukprot:7349014-Ditylum_brightwellii.AAC.1
MGKSNNPVDSAWRNLIFGNPTGQENYCDKINKQFVKHNIVEKVDALYHKIQSNNYVLTNVITQHETLDRQITEMMLCDEQKCWAPKTGKAWSIKLVHAARQ